jgi:predicted NACHT family NTPase
MTGLEPWIVTTAMNFLAPIVEEVCKGFLKDGAGKLLKEGGDSDVGKAVKEMVFEASKAYAKKYADRHGILKVLWMREHISLESVYTGVKFLDESETNRWISVDALEQSYRESKNRRFQKEGKTQDGMMIADDKQFLMVLGQPGAGKSTFLRRMGLEALNGKQEIFSHKCIPVFLELKTFKDDKVDIQKQIVAEFATCGFPEPEKFTENALKQGKLLILLDGLDEVPKVNTNAVITQIEDFVDRYDKNRFISSCRIAAYRSKFRRFFDVAMADFDNEQISEFINNWFRSEKDKLMGTAQKCWELLQNDENEAAMELARTPLLLTFLCLVYDRSQGFSSNRSSLYSKALRIWRCKYS